MQRAGAVGGADQLEVGLDQRDAPRRDRGIALVMHPTRELVPGGRRCALDPLQPPDRRAPGGGQDLAPAGQATLLGVRIKQGKGRHAAGEHCGQPAGGILGEGTDRAPVIAGGDDPDAPELGWGKWLGSGQPGTPARRDHRSRAGRGHGGHEPMAAQRPPREVCDRQRPPLGDRATPHGQQADGHRSCHRDQRLEQPGGRRRSIQQRDRGQGSRRRGSPPRRPGSGPSNPRRSSGPNE